MSNSDLPYPNPETFVGAFERMDLSELRQNQFLVAINTGNPTSPDFICRSVRGPYSLSEMAEEVGIMWRDQLHHAHVTVLQKDRNAKARWLSPEVVDYIEQNFEDIITEEFLGNFTGEFTCRAQIFDTDTEPKPQDEAEPQDGNQVNP
jgi:hypothetical protein